MEISEMSFSTFQEQKKEQEGLVFLGTGGGLQTWVDGVFNELKDEDLVKEGSKFEDVFSQVIKLVTTGGRIDLVFVFAKNAPINMGRLPIWRLGFNGRCSWISDYLVNYRDHHEA